MSEAESPEFFTVMLLGTLGFIAGAIILLYDANSTSESQAFISTADFLVWLFLISVQTALYAVFPVLLVKTIKQFSSFFAGLKVRIALSSLLLAFLFWCPLLFTQFILSPYSNPLAHSRTKIAVIFLISFVTTALPAAIGSWLVQAGLRANFEKVEPTEKHLRQYLHYQQHLQRLLWIFAVTVGLATLSMGATRKAIIAGGLDADRIPSILVLTFGAYLTLITALVYVPTYTSLLQAGHRLCDAFVPVPSPDSKSWDDVYSKRKNVEELLQLRMPSWQSFRTIAAIFAPLFTGLVSVLLGS